MNYRQDIDGLRAIAVVAVIASHLPGKYLASGHLGVDVFFVISGFVITASLFGQSPASISGLYVDFFARRVKRLLPALIACVGITSLYVLRYDPFPDSSIEAGIASLFGLSNIVLYLDQLDYFAASSKFNAFTHTWSLAVEEQFYLIFPLIIWLGFFNKNSGSVSRFTVIVCGLSLASLIAFVYLYDINQPAAYFLTPMRIWELGAGALAYIFSISAYSAFARKIADKCSLVLVALLIGVFFAPLEYAVASTVAAIFLSFWVLLCSPHALAGRFLSMQPAVFIGKISYSLYLWHWPVITQKAFGLSSYSGSPVVYIALMLLLASLSYYCIENPLRRKRWSSRKGREIGVGFSVAAVLALGIAGTQARNFLSHDEQVRERFPTRFLPLISSGKPHNPTCVIDGKRPITATTFDDCTFYPKDEENPMIWAMGDSHAGNIQGMLFDIYEKFGLGVHLVTTPGLPFPVPTEQGYAPRETIFAAVYSNLKEGDVVLAPRAYYIQAKEGQPVIGNIHSWFDKLPSLIDSLEKKGVNLILFAPLPIFENMEDARACPMSFENRSICVADRETLLTKNRPIYDRLRNLSKAYDNVYFFDPFPSLCPASQTLCYPDEDGVFLFADKGHLTYVGSRKITYDFFKFLTDKQLVTSQQ